MWIFQRKKFKWPGRSVLFVCLLHCRLRKRVYICQAGILSYCVLGIAPHITRNKHFPDFQPGRAEQCKKGGTWENKEQGLTGNINFCGRWKCVLLSDQVMTLLLILIVMTFKYPQMVGNMEIFRVKNSTLKWYIMDSWVEPMFQLYVLWIDRTMWLLF